MSKTYKTGINDLSYFCKTISFLDKIIDEVEFFFEGNNISVNFMDPSRICIGTLTLKDILEKEIKTSGKFRIDLLKKILSPFSSLDVVDFTLSKEEAIFKKGFERFTLKREIDWDEFEVIPVDRLRELAFDFKFDISKELLKDILKKAFTYSEILKMITDKTNISYNSKGGLGEYTYEETELQDKSISGSYSILFLKILNSSIFMENFHCSLKTDHPLQILYEDSLLKFEMYLAPRVEEVDFDDDDDMEAF